MKSEDEKEKQKKAGNPLFILIIFVVLIGFVFFVPEIYKKYNSNIAEFLGISEGEKDKRNPEQDKEQASVSAFYQIGSKKTLHFNEIDLSDISLENGILKMKVNTEDTFDLTGANYYLEFWENKKTFVGRRVLKGKVNRSLPLEIDVTNLNISTITYFTVSHTDDSVIEAKPSSSDESGLYSLVCTKGNTSYDYEFYLNKLTKVKMKYSYTNSNLDEYSNEYTKYQKKEKEYNEFNGVTSTIVDNSTSFIFSTEFDYGTAANFDKVGVEHLFSKGAYNHVVEFRMDAEGYECS